MDIYLNPKLLPALDTDKRYIVFYGGRASSKSWAVADILLIRAFTEKSINILCVKGTMRSINDSVKALLEQSIIRNGWELFFTITDKEIVCHVTKSKFIFSGLQHPDRLKSIENISALWIEEGTVDVKEEAIDILAPTIFRVEGSKIYITFNPRLKEDAVYKKFITNTHPDALVIKINYYDNPWLSNEIKAEIKLDKKRDLAKYKWIWEGELALEAPGALWKYEYFIHKKEDTFDKVVVAIDPAGSESATADEAGIVVAGKKGNNAWILRDASGRFSPLDQCRRAINLFYDYEADFIVIEKNGVGAGFKTIIKQVDSNVPIREVNASRGKKVRAYPVASLYQEGRIFHNDVFEKLEYEMTSWDEETSKISPGRIDAAVYAIHALILKDRKIPAGLTPVKMSTVANKVGTMRPRTQWK